MPRKVTSKLLAAAQAYTEAAFEELARRATHAKSEVTHISACQELLNCGQDRVSQGISAGEGMYTRPIAISWANEHG